MGQVIQHGRFGLQSSPFSWLCGPWALCPSFKSPLLSSCCFGPISNGVLFWTSCVIALSSCQCCFQNNSKKYIYVEKCWKFRFLLFVCCFVLFFLPLSSIIQFKNHFLMFISSLTFTVVTVFISRDVLVCLVSHSSFWLRNASG